ncbi:hypothetical protein BDS110ZK25_75410 [Bradyrhizobium diazoefficiens]|uniref:Uncharacterized protein n=1 Tax=Bradyrhizobium diazoefficiens TaxID=1355477 RepID=A0A809YH10_9BRAD|nr:hypothetical protein H12S4_20150 [Bradyrhizobium diazoefficiens]BCA01422.1 hypothetical protein H12S4_23260 [Bradyrhizobium diazoefficiens]BCA18789.1 hypothetical protein BDHH15_20040 [Bradyrhizobium diazoefficiens]BCE28228.1 hypothetical protein XF2B_19970 [Bradyrhizobium diazoefficiens]BCE36961.1 hypothetical protein XF3B_19920 [Bradyrhizobium diazoefficiens]
MTVVGPVRMVKEAGTVQQGSELGSRESMVAPFHLGGRATPCLVLEHGPEAKASDPRAISSNATVTPAVRFSPSLYILFGLERAGLNRAGDAN